MGVVDFCYAWMLKSPWGGVCKDMGPVGGARGCCLRCPLPRDSHAVSAGRDGDPQHIPNSPPRLPRLPCHLSRGGGCLFLRLFVG